MQILIVHPEYAHLETEINRVISNFETSGDDVLEGERNTIKKVDIKGVSVNIKHFKIPNAFNALVYKYIRKSKAKRSFEYANILLSKGINTPFPIAYYEKSTVFGLKESYYLSVHLEYNFDFRVLIHQPRFPNRRLILEQFTAFTFKLHEHDIEFLDHSPGNTLINKTSENNFDFYLIDLNRMRFRTLNFKSRLCNFRRLWLSKTMVAIVAKSYSRLSGHSYEDTYNELLRCSRRFQRIKNAKKLRRSGRRPKFAS